MNKSQQILLEKIKTTDFQFYKKIYTNKSLMQYVGKTLNQENAQKSFNRTLKKMSQKAPKSMLYVIRTHDRLNIGVIGLRWNQPDNNHVEIGVIISKQYQRNGYAHQAKLMMIKYAFKQFNITRIIANCSEKNKAANLANKKLGFSKIKTYISNKKEGLIVQWKIDNMS